jgi:hypothetical protein
MIGRRRLTQFASGELRRLLVFWPLWALAVILGYCTLFPP